MHNLERVFLLRALRLAFRQIVSVILITVPCLSAAHAATNRMKPANLTCDSLVNPLGIDDRQPTFSWKLQDAAFGARQTAYELEVATKPALLLTGKPDVWDSGKVASEKSVGVPYSGPPLEAQHRYYWQVKVWDKDGRPYPVSDSAWWETALLDSGEWRAQWIAYEDLENKSVRESGAVWITNPKDPNYKVTGDTRHDFRLSFVLDKPVKRAELYLTGRDTASAWVNGKQVVQPQPLPAWGVIPWRRYRSQEITAETQAGRNVLAIEVVSYESPKNIIAMPANGGIAPMSACLYVEMTDGSFAVFSSSKQWRSALNAAGDWFAPQADDSRWQAAVPYESLDPSASPMPRPWPTGSVKMLRHEFRVKGPVVAARLYATALGAYQFHINGKRIGDEILAPGWTDFRTRVFYQVYDVTGDVRVGENAIGAYLAPGWYTTPLIWEGEANNYGDTPAALKAQLWIKYADGSSEWVTTNDSTKDAWKAADSPILKAEIYDGETLDARRDQPGWDKAGFSDAKWEPVEEVHPTEPTLLAQNFQPIRIERVLTAKRITSPKPGTYIYDFGQNLAGAPRLRVQGPAGTDIRLRFGEVLNSDDTLYVANLRNAKATDHFILSGKGIETFQPEFTYHGFRYAELTGFASKPDAATLQAVIFHTDAPITATLRTGSPMVNQLWSNILWGQRSNFMSVPTDCPQRDERLGWSGDAEVFWRTASYNMNLAQFSKKYAGDLRATQSGTAMYGIFAPGQSQPNPGYGPGWSDAGVIVPWTAWLATGDARLIEQNWEAMEKYLSAIQSANPDFLWSKNLGDSFGDWLATEGDTRETLIATAYWAYDASLMQQMAHALGRTEDEQRYAELFRQIKAAFIQTFVTKDGYIPGAKEQAAAGNHQAGDTQTGYVLALHMNLVPDDLRQAAGDRLAAKIQANGWRLGTGFVGTPYLLAVLVDTGHADLAYRLLLNTAYPSWGYMVEHGATTMWERWNGDQMLGDPVMNSFNHYAYGAVAAWMYRYAAGVDALPSGPGFHTVSLHPNFDPRLGSLDFSYDSPYGEIKSAWSVTGHNLSWTVTIPPNATARLALSSAQASALTLEGEMLARSGKVRSLGVEQGVSTYELPSGTFFFKGIWK